MKYLLNEEDLQGEFVYMVAVMKSASHREVYPENNDDFIYIAEKVMWIIFGVAKSYNLTFAEHISINGTDRWVYRYTSVEWLREELEFLQLLLNDNLLVNYITNILYIVSKALSNPNKLEIVFEGLQTTSPKKS